jgi:aminomethyltransferase
MANVVHTPLYDKHVALGGKMVDFAGFMMPVQYEGIISEHNQVRTKCGIFDLSHMGEFEIKGAGASEAIRKLMTNSSDLLKDGQIIYSPMCNATGTIIDDMLAYRHSADHWTLVVNASNIKKDETWVKSQIPSSLSFENRSDEVALVAVQGPLSVEVLGKHYPVSNMDSFTFTEGEICGEAAIVSRTGYTGEDGFEIYTTARGANLIWDLLMADERVAPIGLGARDTLRFEAKLMLYGNDIDGTTTPLEAGLGWTVKLDGPDFNGKDVLLSQKAEKVKRKLVGFEMLGRGIARHEYPVICDGEEAGYVTSGTFSPTLQKNLGLCYVPSKYAEKGTKIEIQIRKKNVEAVIVKTPFYRRKRKEEL